jgi:hypothetical protein
MEAVLKVTQVFFVVCAYAYWRTRANVVAPNAFRYLEVK